MAVPRASQSGASQSGAGQPSASYVDPRLAALYDALNPPDASSAFYLALAGPQPARILDMGCGTGVLACEFAARGHDVTGADPAAAMLAVARGRPGGDRVRWVESDAAGLAIPARFDLIIMTGHVFQLLLEDRDVRAALEVLAGHLAPGGRIAFETRNPAVREWQEWNPRDTRQRVDADGVVADVHYDICAVAGELVTYETWFRFAGDRDALVVPDTLRFMDQAQVAAFLAAAGLPRVTWHGDWDGSPYGPDSPEIIAIAASGRAGHPGGIRLAALRRGPGRDRPLGPGQAARRAPAAAASAQARPLPPAWPSRRDLTSFFRTLPTRERGRSGQTSTCLGALTPPRRSLANARRSSPGTSWPG